DQQYCVPGDTTSCASPVGEWNFQEGKGTTVNDNSGNGYTGTWAGTGNHWANGQTQKVGSFNGSDDKVTTTHKFFGAATSFTLSGWIRPTSFAASAYDAQAVSEYYTIMGWDTVYTS